MRGSIHKKGKIFYAVIPIRGKRKWFRGGDTKKDAQRELNDRLREVDAGTYKEIPKTTFSEFADLWLKNYVEPKAKPSTQRGYRDIITRLLKPLYGPVCLTEITTVSLQSFVANRLKSVKAKTVCNEIVVLKLMFKHAYRWGYLRHNPAEYVERPRVVKKEIDILSPDEVNILLSHATNHYRIAFLTGFLTGMRAGELWGLKWDDIDWNSKQIYVRRSLWNKQFQTTKTKTSTRKIDMTDGLIRELKKWKLASPVSEHDVVFPSAAGGLTQHDNVVSRHFNQALRKAGLRQVSFHSLRHSNASIRIRSGQNIKYIQSQMGHAGIQITMDTYGHLFHDENFNRQQAELLEKSCDPVRNPLEKPAFSTKKGLTENRKSLNLFGSGGRI
ncbi:MAG: tyrosine-type recombinase/integrase [Thermodesulfovibrionia bacterium]|nr:tyrosine-type recombinase/integrase [Thermodesulfovibrionia bacterium]